MLNTPLNVHWELTNKCNLRCQHCYQQDDINLYAPLLSLDERQLIARRIVDAGVFEVTLTGGEIFLVPGVIGLVEFFNEKGIAPHITCNGTRITAEIAEQLARCQVSVQVSIDSAEPDDHDMFRGVDGAFAGATHGVSLLTSAAVPTSIAYCATGENINAIRGVADVAANLGVDRLCVGEIMPFYGDAETRNSLSVDLDEMKSFATDVVELRSEYSDRLEISIALEGGSAYHSDLRDSPCSALSRDVAILYDGYVYPCPFVRAPTQRMGNVLEQTLEEIWQGSAAERFRENKPQSSRDPKCPANTVYGDGTVSVVLT